MRRSHFSLGQHLLFTLIALAALCSVLTPVAQAQVGIITTYAGGGPNNLPALQANLFYPNQIVLDGSGNLYVAGTLQNMIFRVDAVTGIITAVAGDGNPYYIGDGVSATGTGLNQPTGSGIGQIRKPHHRG